MSKPMTRVLLSVIISLAILAAIFTVVQAGADRLSLNSGSAKAHMVNGAMTNLNHDRLTVDEQASYRSQLDAYYGQTEQGHDCNSSQQNSPDD